MYFSYRTWFDVSSPRSYRLISAFARQQRNISKYRLIISSLLLLLILDGCGGGSSSISGNQSLLLGKWITETCTQVAVKNNGMSISRWNKGLYEFTRQGKIRRGQKVYTDPNCEVTLDTAARSELRELGLYQDLGSEFLIAGIKRHRIKVSTTTSGSNRYSSGSYMLYDDLLCLSENYNFEQASFSVLPVDSSAIDFNSCLERL